MPKEQIKVVIGKESQVFIQWYIFNEISMCTPPNEQTIIKILPNGQDISQFVDFGLQPISLSSSFNNFLFIISPSILFFERQKT